MSRDDFLADISNAVPSSKTGDVYKINETTSSVKTIDGDDNAILQSKRTIEFLKGVMTKIKEADNDFDAAKGELEINKSMIQSFA